MPRVAGRNPSHRPACRHAAQPAPGSPCCIARRSRDAALVRTRTLSVGLENDGSRERRRGGRCGRWRVATKPTTPGSDQYTTFHRRLAGQTPSCLRLNKFRPLWGDDIFSGRIPVKPNHIILPILMGHSWLFRCRASVPASAFPSRLSQNTCPRISRGDSSVPGWVGDRFLPEPRPGSDFPTRVVPFGENPVRYVPERADNREPESTHGRKTAFKHAWSRRKIL